MLYHNLTVDPRDGYSSGGSCQVCCCAEVKLRPGETNLMRINYAPWSLPIGGPGVIPEMSYTVEVTSTCSDQAIDGFGPPSNIIPNLAAALNAVVTLDWSLTATPAGNTFSYAIVPLQGPSHGLATISPAGVITYTPNNGYTGRDYFHVKMTDAQGRSVIYPAYVDVGATGAALPREALATTPFIDVSKVSYLQGPQHVQFPIYMPVMCRPCDSYKMTIKQPARDCNGNVYHHFSCYTITCNDCF